MTAGSSAADTHTRSIAITLNRAVYGLSRKWLLWFVVGTGLWVGLPWLAPVFMRLGWAGPAKAVYFFYSLQCHQLPERSFFLFGPKAMYSLQQIQSAWKATYDPAVLRQFIGSPTMGYKVAWSDRMVSLYTSIPLGALLWWALRRRIRPLPIWLFAVLALPMIIDGGTHLVSDVAGIGQGFRYTNAWLGQLTGYRLPASFYLGDALGSFNSWMRLITGAMFGLAAVWTAIPHMDSGFSDAARQIEDKFARAEVDL